MVSLVGAPSVVEEAAQSLVAVRGLTSTEMDIPPTLTLEFAALEAKYHTMTKRRGRRMGVGENRGGTSLISL